MSSFLCEEWSLRMGWKLRATSAMLSICATSVILHYSSFSPNSNTCIYIINILSPTFPVFSQWYHCIIPLIIIRIEKMVCCFYSFIYVRIYNNINQKCRFFWKIYERVMESSVNDGVISLEKRVLFGLIISSIIVYDVESILVSNDITRKRAK